MAEETVDGNLTLVLKRPKDKPPFIGILFEHDFKASTTNKHWSNSYRTMEFQMTIEPKTDFLEVIVSLTEMNFKSRYKVKNYSIIDLHKWLTTTQSQKRYNFGHVVLKNGEHSPAKDTNKRPWCIPLNQITFIKEH